jgi:hypothetical protein
MVGGSLPMDDGHDLPAAWQETLVRSKAQAERGESVPLEPFMDRLRASIDHMKTARALEHK